MLPVGTKIYAADGRSVGRILGGSRRCRLEGCNSLRMSVRWNDGTLTWPCLKGLEAHKDGYKILR